MGGNNRDFGSLEFRRLLKRFILSGGHKIPLLPGSPIELAEASIPSNTKNETKPEAKVFDEPCLSQEVTDELWSENTEAPVHKINIDEIDISKPAPVDNPDDFLFDDLDQDVQMHIVGPPIPIEDPDEPDFLFDEIAPEIKLHTVGEEGFNYYAGWLGKGDKKLTKTLSESQSLPTSNLEDFEHFVCSKWIDMLNTAWTGTSDSLLNNLIS